MKWGSREASRRKARAAAPIRGTRDEGDVKVYKTSDTPEKRINDSVGEYVEFEEVEEQNPKK